KGTFLVRADHLEITTPKQAAVEGLRAEVWVRVSEAAAAEVDATEPVDRRPVPIVHARFADRPLNDALEELADQAGVSILLDARRAEEKVKERVTARLINMPLDAAVRTLADMAELRALDVDNGIYVTTKENAQNLQAEQDKRRQAMMQAQAGVGGIG